jgi:hypothetical protein
MTTASSNRSDVAAVYPAWGPSHGYEIGLPVSAGRHTICTFGINVGPPDVNPYLGCGTIDVGTEPFGVIDTATRTTNKMRVQGWALDPDTNASIDVHAYVDGQFSGVFPANGSRPDVANAYPGYGAAHGFDLTVDNPAGRHQVCVYGIKSTPGVNPLLGCASPNGSPVGNADAIVAQSGGGSAISGWALDPDHAEPIAVHLYVDGQFASASSASEQRPDIASAFPSYGAAHGYTIAVPAGHHTACIWAIDPDGAVNPRVGCLTY